MIIMNLVFIFHSDDNVMITLNQFFKSLKNLIPLYMGVSETAFLKLAFTNLLIKIIVFWTGLAFTLVNYSIVIPEPNV